MPSMTRAHFQFIADAIANSDLPDDARGSDSDVYHAGTKRHVAEFMADALRATNYAFDRQRFIAAATRSR